MNHDQYAMLRFENSEPMYIKALYITSYAYIREQNKTVVTILGERKELYFPGNQIKEIHSAINGIHI